MHFVTILSPYSVSLNRWQELNLIKQGFLNHLQRQLRGRQRHKATDSSESLLDLSGFALLHSLRACLITAFKNKSAELVGVSTWSFLLLSKECPSVKQCCQPACAQCRKCGELGNVMTLMLPFSLKRTSQR